MAVYKWFVTILLMAPALAVASAITGVMESSIAPSPDSGDSGNSDEVQTLEDQAQMRNTGESQDQPQYQMQNRSVSSGASLTTKASISADGQYYCPPKQGYATPNVSPYRPNGYSQCVYQPSSP
ncbi:MAG: hypothetical protein P1U34_08940 [Coxiellaceae bacterium]|nr:hypothetical protein [Coxiellaceae bacterium]